MAQASTRLHCPRCLAVFRKALRRCPADGAPLEHTAEEPLFGVLLGGRYLIQSVIGEGGMGRVYFATDETGTGRYAIKVLYGELAAVPRQVERFAREAARALGFDHPNLVRMLDVGSAACGPYAVMEHVAGRSLTRLLAAEGALEPARVVRLASDLCRGLSYMHGRSILHRDVKTGNVMVTEADGLERAMLFDFGVSLLLSGEEERLTTKQTAIGTLSYMAPERALCEPFDHRADLFSLGVVIYQMLSGQRPFVGTPMMQALQNLTVAPPPVAARVPGLAVDRRLEEVALRLMARDPAARYQSADEVLAALEAA